MAERLGRGQCLDDCASRELGELPGQGLRLPARVPALPVAGAGGTVGQRVGLVDTDPGPGLALTDRRVAPRKPSSGP